MNIIQTILNTSGDSIRKSFRRFPLTQSAIAVLIILTSVFSNMFDSYGKNSPIDHVALPFLHLTVLGFFYVESNAFRKKSVKIVSLILVLGVSVLYVLMGPKVNAFGWGEALLSRAANTFLFAALFYVCLAIYALIRHSGLSIDSFAARIYAHGFAAVIVLGVLSTGIVLIALIIQVLFLPRHFDFVSRVWVFCAMTSFSVGFFYAMESLSRTGAKFFALIAKNVLLPVLTIAFVIIYGYIAKIAITRIMPSNEVFPILSALFILGMPIWTINRDFLSDPKARKLNDALAAFFLPFIALQIFSLGIRIKDYGLTPSRYLGVALIVLELAYFAFVFFRARRTEPIFLAAALIACIAFAVPGINAQDLSRQQQFKILLKFQEGSTGFDSDDFYRVVGAYTYLRQDEEGKALIKTLDEKTVAGIKDLHVSNGNYYGRSSYYDFYSNRDIRIPVDGFTSVITEVICSAEYDERTSKLGMAECIIPERGGWKASTGPNSEKAFTLDFKDLVAELSTVKNIESEQLPVAKIELPNGNVFWLDFVGLQVDIDGVVQELNANGVLLEK